MNPKFVFQLDEFFVFAENIEVTEKIISAFKNNSCLNNTYYFEEHQAQLANASSLVFYKMQGSVPIGLSGFFGQSTLATNSISKKEYPLSVLQFSYDRDFAHVNYVCKEARASKQTKGGVTEIFSVELPNELMSKPQFFTNHRTQGKDVVVQDVSNKLYLISSNGKILWDKKLDGPILGEINEVDILRNGKKQLAFSTSHTFYLLDRTGKAVAPFPIKFNDAVTQPLSVFDYENNRKYRFVLTQGKEVLMLDGKGKTVKGFTFKKAKSDIVLSPQHLRIGNKDYIIVAEESGKLNILSRVGKSRVNVSRNFKFSKIPIQKEGSNFVVITSENKKEKISQSGKVSSQTLDVSGNYSFSILGNTKVTVDDNLLRVNGKLVELPFGIYSRPSLFYANRTTYTTITETQENKVYVIDKSGSILSGFPVFGKSEADLANTAKNRKLSVVVQGDAKEIVLYSFR